MKRGSEPLRKDGGQLPHERFASLVVPLGHVENGAGAHASAVGAEADRLVAADTDVAQAVEFHQTTIDDKGLATMKPLAAIELPPNSEIRVEPGSYHLMLVAITRELKVGDTVMLRLTFEKAGTVELVAPVRDR